MEPDLSEIAGRIRKVFIGSLSLNVREEDLEYGARLDEVAGLDSLAVLQFIAALEKEFGVVLDPEQLDLAVLKDLDRLAADIARMVGK